MQRHPAALSRRLDELDGAQAVGGALRQRRGAPEQRGELTGAERLEGEIGQIAVAGVQNPDSLVNVGDNDFSAGASTVTLPPSVALAGGAGQILGESLESSNVDIATEFTNLINFQAGYSAASRVITTQDQMIEQLLSIIQP